MANQAAPALPGSPLSPTPTTTTTTAFSFSGGLL